MPVEIPNLIGTSIESLAVCAIFPAESESVALHAKECRPGIRIARIIEGEQSSFVRTRIGILSNGKPHCHVDIARLSYFGSSPPPTKMLMPVRELVELLDGFTGYPANVHVTAKYQMPFSDLPEDGLVRKLGGVSATVSGSELIFTGGEVSISEEPFGVLKWHIESDSVTGEITLFYQGLTLTPHYLVDSERLAELGIAKYVREEEASSGL